jgi:hypothetical protein
MTFECNYESRRFPDPIESDPVVRKKIPTDLESGDLN